MNVQEQIKVLKAQIYSSQELLTKLEDQIKKEQEFPKIGDTYWRIDDIGSVDSNFYNDYFNDNHRQAIGNFFKTEEQAEFVVEKLKVEAELRKFSAPDNNGSYYMYIRVINCELGVGGNANYKNQGTIYFESGEEVQQAIEEVGEERIKKYLFGVEE